jgi:hypothetical protein
MTKAKCWDIDIPEVGSGVGILIYQMWDHVLMYIAKCRDIDIPDVGSGVYEN